MSSVDRRSLLRTVVLVGLPLALAGCIRPMYAPTSGPGGDVAARLAQVAVDPVQDRLGHYLVQETRFELFGAGEPPQPKYRLTMTVKESIQSATVNTLTGRTTSATLVATVTFQLTPYEGGSVLMQGTATATATYDRTQQRFASTRAARDAEIRVARTLADQIRTRIAAHFATAK
ncbi:LPS assembly lipoprotein LptE [Alsobacter sp. R-9]